MCQQTGVKLLVVEVPEVFLTAKGEVAHLFESCRTDQEQKEDPLSDMLRLSEEADQSHEVCSKSEYLQEGVKKFDTPWEMMENARFGFGSCWFGFVLVFAELKCARRNQEKGMAACVCQSSCACMFFFMSETCLESMFCCMSPIYA